MYSDVFRQSPIFQRQVRCARLHSGHHGLLRMHAARKLRERRLRHGLAEALRDGRLQRGLRRLAHVLPRVGEGRTEIDPKAGLASPDHTENLSGLALACIEADFCKSTHFAEFFKSHKIYTFFVPIEK